jgi:hypothetical protein
MRNQIGLSSTLQRFNPNQEAVPLFLHPEGLVQVGACCSLEVVFFQVFFPSGLAEKLLPSLVSLSFFLIHILTNLKQGNLRVFRSCRFCISLLKGRLPA